MMYQSFRAVLLGILVSRLVTGQGCDPSNPFGANCDSSPPAIAIDGQLHFCNMILNQCHGGFPASQGKVHLLTLKICLSPFCLISGPSSFALTNIRQVAWMTFGNKDMLTRKTAAPPLTPTIAFNPPPALAPRPILIPTLAPAAPANKPFPPAPPNALLSQTKSAPANPPHPASATSPSRCRRVVIASTRTVAIRHRVG